MGFAGTAFAFALTAARAFFAASAALRATNAFSIIARPSAGLLSNQISKLSARVELIKEVSILIMLSLTWAEYPTPSAVILHTRISPSCKAVPSRFLSFSFSKFCSRAHLFKILVIVDLIPVICGPALVSPQLT